MRILGIETSCDETGAAIVDNGINIVSNIVASSQELHIKTGGIIPERAAREQVKSIIPVIEEALSPKTPDVDAIAVTVGPGLIGSLLVGVETAKTLAYIWNKPIIPVNHLLAHLYANWLENKNPPSFPLIALIVSGGHTELLLMTGHGKYKWLGGTRDDAAGEAFDKIARLLGLGYPGGPAIAVTAGKFTMRHTPNVIKLPRPMINSDNFDFSFSGLKTAVLREIKKTSLSHNQKFITNIAYEVQESITDVLVEKALRTARETNVKNIILAGGVAANQRLREKFKDAIKDRCSLFVPSPSLCTDNAAAIAACAFFNRNFSPWQKISVNPSLGL